MFVLSPRITRPQNRGIRCDLDRASSARRHSLYRSRINVMGRSAFRAASDREPSTGAKRSDEASLAAGDMLRSCGTLN